MATGTFTYNALRAKTLKERIKTQKKIKFFKLDKRNAVGVATMKSNPRLNWHFESSSRYSGLSRYVPSSSHRLPRSSRRELGLFVSSPTSLSRQLPRSSRRDQADLSPPSSSRRLVRPTHHASLLFDSSSAEFVLSNSGIDSW